ncbi:helix-turn-helix transcriptional regulator [Desulfitobacterium sp.]|uniref:helix-turn-helix domain-containing protein n=1 Tax=Desulfitobacterium sp. TaxID=49981 RepID=UPI002C5F4331|nr:helix-turn-helix transcriptional regulator [Desulfitobacterium sp.]HVJ50054.1 helix-turn-helix transcriptional regulator [Desulfitobacterium sp.]
MENICSRLKILRSDTGLSQVDFAKRLGVTNAHISKIEKEKTIPSEALIRLISKEFGISELWLKIGEKPMYLDQMEANTENLLMKSTEQFNQLLRTDNVVIRAQAAQLNMLFSEIVSNEFSFDNDSDRLKYLRICEKLFYDINCLITSVKDYVTFNQLSFEPNDIANVLKDKQKGIINDLAEIGYYYIKKRR